MHHRNWFLSAAILAGLGAGTARALAQDTATPIRHLVVIYEENVSFDHYFATYPAAANPPGEPAFHAAPGTPAVDNLVTAHLLTNNPNLTNKANGADAADPFRLDRTQANTADMEHAYRAEQLAYNAGKADLFPKYTGRASAGGAGAFGSRGQVMGYFDGNTVTSIWRWAQHFAMSDNFFGETYGPSTPGALELISGQTNGAREVTSNVLAEMVTGHLYVKDGQGGLTMIADADPAGDVCSHGRGTATMEGRNIGDLLNDAGVTWGGFMGGFDLTVANANGTTGCARSSHSNVVGKDIKDYVAHHAWFQYYASTANPRHERPGSLAAIGHTNGPDGKAPDPANHQYDLHDFFEAVSAGNFPAVSFIKQPAFQDGHAGNSDPLDEQEGMTKIVNFIQRQPAWKDTVIILAWDDSDGWYDHAAAAPTSPSFDPEEDQLNGPGKCGTGMPRAGVHGKPVNGRCGPGARLPLLILSPWAKANYVSHVRVSQASIPRFIEDNWLHGQRIGGGSFDETAGSLTDLFDFAGGGKNTPLWLDPATGDVLSAAP